jgi:alkylation response protein AidB-like acyl-CoA dehydrogenase
MIEFNLTLDQHILIDAVDRFVQEELAPQARTAEQARSPSAETVERYESLGLSRLEDPDAGLGVLTRCLVNESLARGDVGAALALDRLGPAATAVRMVEGFGGIEAIAGDRTRRAWCVTPEDGSLRIERNELSGSVHWTPGGVTDLYLLLPDGIALIRDGLREMPVRGSGLRAAAPARIELDRAPIVRFDAVNSAAALAAARLCVASLLLGVMDASTSYARKYAMERVAFGRPIAHHQALTFMLVDMNTAVAGTRLLIHEAAWRLDAGQAAEEAAATAFIEAIDRSAFVGPGCVQVLGGLGYMQEYPVEKHMRESRALGLLFGGIDRARGDAIQTIDMTLMAGGPL